jgi:pimeloyl-ACP methyl ester carboxylesterase
MQLNGRLHNWYKRGSIAEIGLQRLHIFIMDEGDKTAIPNKTLLLFHGFPESSYSYAGALPLLMQRFDRVVLFDFVGFGFSQKPKPAHFSYSLMEQADIALQVWRKLGITGGHVLAHDMGTSVLTELLARFYVGRPEWFSEGFKSVTFTNGGMVLSQAKLRFGQKALMSGMGKILSPVLQQYALFKQQILSAHGNDLLLEEQIRDLYEAITFQSWPGLLHYLVQYLHERLRFEQVRWLPAVRQFQGPLHISWGTDDQVNPEAVPKYLQEKVCPQATLSLTPGLGHFCQIQDPDLWVGPLRSFWGRL